jgi:hypothetical protein
MFLIRHECYKVFRNLLIMKLLRIILIVGISIFTTITNAQTYAKIQLLDGSVESGMVILIANNYLQLKTKSGIMNIERDSIRFQISNPSSTNTKRIKAPRISLVPIKKRFINEIDAGLTFGMPFALRIGYTKWFRANDHWHFGLGTSMQFYRYTMLNGNINARWLLGQDRFVKPFFEAGFGLSYLAYVNGLNFRSQTGFSQFPFGYESDINTVKQLTIGPGLFLDTGLGVAFTTRLIYNATWYNQIEYPAPTYYIEGQYFFSSASLLFSFIF